MEAWQRYDFWLMLVSVIVAIISTIIAIANFKVTRNIRKDINVLQKTAKDFQELILEKNFLSMDSNDKCYYIPKKLLINYLKIDLYTLRKFERLGFWNSGTITYKPQQTFNFFGRVQNKHIIYIGTQEFKMDVYYINGMMALEKLNIDLEKYLINSGTIDKFGQFLIGENKSFHILIDETKKLNI